MKDIWKVLIIVALLCHEFIILPKLIQSNIYKYVKSVNGEIISIQKLSERDSLYAIEYKVDEKYQKINVQCNFLGHIVRWM